MLYCQPKSFYSEMTYISENRPNFLKKLSLGYYEISDQIDNIDPISYLIKMVFHEPKILDDSPRIFALRTFGTYNSLKPKSTDQTMQIYYATIDDGSLYVSYPNISYIRFVNNELCFDIEDEYGDEYYFTIKDIAEDTYQNPYAIESYINYSKRVFEQNNIMAKIPFTLLQHLV